MSNWSQYRKDSSPIRPRLIWSSFGEEGTLKTTFGAQGPGPVVIQSLDFGTEGVLDELRREKEIVVLEYPWRPTESTTQAEAIDLRDAFESDYRHALTYARTVLWDKESQIYPLFTAAQWPEGYEPAPREHAPLQQRYRALINEAKETDINFGLIQGMKSPWAGGDGSGKLRKTKDRIRRGFAEIGELVHVNIEHYVELLPGLEPNHRFMFRTGKLRGPGARSLQYQEMPAVTFAEFGQLLFPESREEDWS